MNENIINMLIECVNLNKLYVNYSHDELISLLNDTYHAEDSIECVTTFLVNFYLIDYDGIEITKENCDSVEVDCDIKNFGDYIVDCVMHDIEDKDGYVTSKKGNITVKSSYNKYLDVYIVSMLGYTYVDRCRLDAINDIIDLVLSNMNNIKDYFFRVVD